MEAAEYQQMAAVQDRHWWFEAKRRTVQALLERHLDDAPSGGAVAAASAGAATLAGSVAARTSLTPASRVLEVGVGTGAMSPVMRRHGRFFAADAYLPALQMLRAHEAPDSVTPAVGADLLTLPFEDASFALIGCFDVLYHRGVPEVGRALEELRRVCAPGGHLAITDSAFSMLRSSHDVATHAARRFRLGELVREVESTGFEMVHASYFHTFLFPAAMVVRLGKRLVHGSPRLEDDADVGDAAAPADVPARSDLTPVPQWQNRLLGAVYRLEIPLSTRFRLPFGVSLMLLARRGD